MAETDDDREQRRFWDKHPYEKSNGWATGAESIERRLNFTGMAGGYGDYNTVSASCSDSVVVPPQADGQSPGGGKTITGIIVVDGTGYIAAIDGQLIGPV